jgi:ADP-heptose:LPS heptosyltransferase
VLSFAPFTAIRAHHRSDHVALLTTAPFGDLAQKSPWFDQILVDARASWRQPLGMLRLAGVLRGFDLVYDLQTSGRSSAYFWLAGRPAWSGVARGCALPHANPARDRMHTLERQREQLAMAGISEFPQPDLSWLQAAPHPKVPPGKFALLVPGAAPHRPEKRWPAERFAALAALLAGRGLHPVIVGTRAEAAAAAKIRAACPTALDLTGRTDLPAVAALAARAAVAVGNDTGPMHLAAAMGCRCVVLFGPASDPALTAPRGPGGTWPIVLRVGKLAELPVERVAAALPEAP